MEYYVGSKFYVTSNDGVWCFVANNLSVFLICFKYM